MALILSCQAISKSHGARLLFERISMGISDGERVGLIGPNGAGKSTFLKLLLGQEAPDSGTISFRKLARLSYVPQDPIFPSGKTVGQVLHEALVSLPFDEAEKEGRLAVILGRMKFANAEAAVETLSGGWTKRLSIACGLVVEPDLLLLDEPTNHLDLEGILWLEDTLKSAPFATLLVSHDRYLLENSVSRMMELSRLYPEGMLTVEGSYSQFLERKADFLSAQEQLQETLANKARRELEWLRRGAKARTRKSQARIDAAGRLMVSLDEVRARNVQQTARVDFTGSNRKTKRLLTLDTVRKGAGERTLFQDLSLTLSPGDKLGLLGQNGSGKTTLLKLLNGELAPDTGRIERADGLRVVTFDQNRRQLNPEETLRRSLAPAGDSVIYRDRSLHVHSWARRFLFSNEQLDLPISRLSGGEQARVMIARMMLEPADVLLLDEPTNDLDIPTLEVLEESLLDFPGALVLVTHDRFLLDRVSTTVLALDGEGQAELFADYDQWWQAQQSSQPAPKLREVPATSERPSGREPQKRLSYLDRLEWDRMEQLILEAEAELERKQKAAEDPAIASNAAELTAAHEALDQARHRVDQLYARWAELEAKLQ
jgi:ABC transport system ATP-binding/permease protein